MTDFPVSGRLREGPLGKRLHRVTTGGRFAKSVDACTIFGFGEYRSADTTVSRHRITAPATLPRGESVFRRLGERFRPLDQNNNGPHHNTK